MKTTTGTLVQAHGGPSCYPWQASSATGIHCPGYSPEEAWGHLVAEMRSMGYRVRVHDRSTLDTLRGPVKTPRQAADLYRKELIAGTWAPWKAEMLLMSMRTAKQVDELRRLMGEVDREAQDDVAPQDMGRVSRFIADSLTARDDPDGDSGRG